MSHMDTPDEPQTVSQWMIDHYAKVLAGIVGRKVVSIRMDEETLALLFDDDTFVQWTVEGNCCSTSYFYDFHGVRKLIDNGPIISARAISLFDSTEEEDMIPGRYQEEVKVYGFELVTQHPHWGEQTSVFSFRNDSNGCYGGDMLRQPGELVDLPDLFDDVIETKATLG